jgi:cation diffusion facilitator CzcD-associated flavoprotein CzcO
MLLKSESCASSLFDPKGDYSLRRYCSREGIPYPEYGTPVSRELFAQYAISFQQKLVPNVEDATVTAVSRTSDGFEVRLTTGETLAAGTVIVATGNDHTEHLPAQIAKLPAELRSHSADHYDLGVFKNKDVTVIGGGQSAIETAALLREEGASVSLLVRERSLAWNPDPSRAHRSWFERLRNPRTRFGDGRGLWIYDNAPGLFHYLPQSTRVAKVKTALGPAGAWWLKDRVVGRLPILLGHHICGAEARGGRVRLQVRDQNERPQELLTDHVIAATGYRFEIDRLPFLSQSLKSQLRRDQQSPRLSPNFESSVPGLYFAGLASAVSFGPAMRFLAGADYTARRISRHIALARRVAPASYRPSEKCPEF